MGDPLGTRPQAGPEKWASYHSYLRNHILPRFGHVALNKITRQDAKVFVKDLKQRLAERTVIDVMSLLGLLLREAVADRRIGFNPCQGIRIATGQRVERTPATTDQINRIVARIRRRSDQILVITAAYTGMRWGELAGLAGLARTNTHLGDGIISVHKDVGALHEVRGRLYLGPPKTAAAVRDIHLPPFLVDLLHEVLDGHDHDTVFCGEQGAWMRRSAMSRRVWRPAVNGSALHPGPVLENMHFHDNRHTHKTWLIEDDIPDRASAAPWAPPGRRPRHLQPRHPGHDRPRHQRPPSPLASRPRPRRSRPTTALRGLTDPDTQKPGPTNGPGFYLSRESCSPLLPNLRGKQRIGRYTTLGEKFVSCRNAGGRYWDRTSDLSGVNGRPRTPLTSDSCL